MQAIYYFVCCAFDLGKSFSHRKRTRLFVVQQEVSLCSEVSSPLSNDFHGPSLWAVDLCDACMSSNEGLHWVQSSWNFFETFNSLDKVQIPIPGFSNTFFLLILEEFNCTNTIRSSAMLLSSSHSLVVSITILQFMPDCSYSVQGALSVNHNVIILMAGMDHHDICYSLPWFWWVPIVHSLCHHVYEWRRVQSSKWCVVCVNTSIQPERLQNIIM